ncbi:MAG: hypothetical protein QNJ09_05380 [Paracoccaceae bacterium]|nr:hypothetical protein [Paracoccaceae bacterium]
MTALASPAARATPPARLLKAVFNLVMGSLLCLSPLTAVLVLGWLTRRMATRVHTRLGHAAEYPGWVLGPRGEGWIVRLMGGLAANIRAGVVSAVGLAALTLPFTTLWLGAWWAGWENSFNKGYEQSAVGPVVWLLGAMIALPILSHLPMALAYSSAEGRLGAFFECRRIRSVVRAAGWRMPWLAFLSVVLCLPFLGLRALAVFIEGIVPGFSDMTPAEQMQVAQVFDVAGAAVTFVSLLFLRDLASSIYARAVPRAARGRSMAVWQDHEALAAASKRREPSRPTAALWLLISCAIWSGLPILIVMSQFMNYTPILWLTHPVFLLPWAG